MKSENARFLVLFGYGPRAFPCGFYWTVECYKGIPRNYLGLYAKAVYLRQYRRNSSYLADHEEGWSISTKPENVNYQVVGESPSRLIYECSNLNLKVSQYIWKTESGEHILDKPFVLWADTFPTESISFVVAQRGHFIEFLSLGRCVSLCAIYSTGV